MEKMKKGIGVKKIVCALVLAVMLFNVLLPNFALISYAADEDVEVTEVNENASDEQNISLANTTYSTLADVVEVGDFVNYDASSNGTRVFTSNNCLTGTSISGTISTSNSFNSNAPAQWRVLSVNKETGVVELLSVDPTAQTVSLTGGDGFINSKTVLNNIGAIYGHGKGATRGRSINKEDIEPYSNYKKESFTGYKKYGESVEYTSGNFYKQILDNNGNVIGYDNKTTSATSTNPISIKHTFYNYNPYTYMLTNAFNTIFLKSGTESSSAKNGFWLNSTSIFVYPNYCAYGVSLASSGYLSDNTLYSSNTTTTSSATWAVTPVVELKAKLKTTGQNEDDVWQLYIEETENEKSTLADVVQVGDYVNYDASSNGTRVITNLNCSIGSSISSTISTATNFNSNAPAQWRVLSVNKETKVVELMSTDPTAQTVTLSAGNGFVYGEEALNKICSIYGYGKGATGGRSLNINDVEQYSTYNPEVFVNSENSSKYNDTLNFTSGKFYKEVKNQNGDITGYELLITNASTSNSVTLTQNYYTYTAKNYFSNSIIYNMIFKNSTNVNSNKPEYWLASRQVNLLPASGSYFVSSIYNGNVNNTSGIYDSRGYSISPAKNIVPVVTLEANLQTTGQNANGVWQLYIEENQNTELNLADVVQVGDFVNYDANSYGLKSFTSDNCLAGTSISDTISTGYVFNSGAPAQWRVLSVDKENGVVELLSSDPTAQKVTLTGGDGFINSETVLNSIGSIYGHGKGAEIGRSINIKDIEQYSNFVKENYRASYKKYGETVEYTQGNFYKEILDAKGNVIGYEKNLTTASESNPITMTQSNYLYTPQSYMLSSIIYNTIFKKRFRCKY